MLLMCCGACDLARPLGSRRRLRAAPSGCQQTIIEETLERICSQTSYQGKMDVHVPYNTPKSLPIEDELAKRTELHGCALRCERVIGSTSKAHNLEYALKVRPQARGEPIVWRGDSPNCTR
jgi:hypothetical protein